MLDLINPLAPLVIGSGFSITINSANIVVAGLPIVIPQTVVSLTPSATNYVFVNNAGVVTLNTTGFPATGLPICTIVCNATRILSIVDNRPDFVLAAGNVTSVNTLTGAVNLADLDSTGKVVKLEGKTLDPTVGTATAGQQLTVASDGNSYIPQNKPFIDPRDYGTLVDGNGSVDNQPVFQAAIAAMEAGSTANKKLAVLCPPGEWYINKPLVFSANGDSFFAQNPTGCTLSLNHIGPGWVTHPSTYPLAASVVGGANPPYLLLSTTNVPYVNASSTFGNILNGLASFSVLNCGNFTDNSGGVWLSAHGYNDNDTGGGAGANGEEITVQFFAIGLPVQLSGVLTTSNSGKKVLTSGGANITSGAWCFGLSYDGATIRLYQGAVSNWGSAGWSASMTQVQSTAATGTVVEPPRSQVILGPDLVWTEGGANNNSPNMQLGPMMFSNTTRGMTGGGVTVNAATFVNDANTMMLFDWATQYDVFTVAKAQGSTKQFYVPVKQGFPGGGIVTGMTFQNIAINGKTDGMGGLFINTAASYVDVNLISVRRGFVQHGNGTFENTINIQSLQTSQGSLTKGDFGIFNEGCGACGISVVHGNGRPLNVNIPYPFYWAGGSIYHADGLVVAANQGVVTDFVFDHRGQTNATDEISGLGGDDEVVNTAWKRSLRIYGAHGFNCAMCLIGMPSAGTIAPISILDGGVNGSYTFTNLQAETVAAAPAVFAVLGTPSTQPITIVSPTQVGGNNTPWTDTANTGIVINNPITNTTNLMFSENIDGSVQYGSKTFANLGTPSNGRVVYCSDCTIANPCAGGGSGALAKRINGAWICN